MIYLLQFPTTIRLIVSLATSHGWTLTRLGVKMTFLQGMPLILVVYVDDLFLIGSEPLMIKRKKELSLKLEMKGLGLRYTFRDMRLHGYTNVDWARSVIDRKHASRCYFSLESTIIKCMSKKHKFVALSMEKAEYISASMASCEVVWLRNLFREFFEQVLDIAVIYWHNKSGL